MKSKIQKIQILKKGMAILMASMFMITPISYATTSLDDSYLESSFLDQLLYGTVGSTVEEIEKYLSTHATLYITNETQLRAFAEYVNNGHSCYRKEIILLNDIELSDEEWTPIGKDGSIHFQGTFDGKGHTISGLTYLKEGKTINDLSYIGLFGFIHKNGTIKNLITNNFNINLLYEEYDATYSFLGNIVGENNGKIENCQNISDIFGCIYIGGIAGKNTGTINNCINTGNVKGNNAIGGIVGLNHGNISNVTNTGKIIGNSVLGGIVGEGKDDSYLTNAINEGDIYTTGYNNGGIIGWAKNAVIEKSINKGTVNGDFSNGGIVGYSNSSEISHVINEGEVTGLTNNNGGIIGKAENESVISNCQNTGNVKGNNAIGGIIGNWTGGEEVLINCFNEGNITGSQDVGGIVGLAGGTYSNKIEEINIKLCRNDGKVAINKYGSSNTSNNGAGILGTADCVNTINVTECLNQGDVNGNGCGCAGIIGNITYYTTCNVSDCYNAGNISALYDAAGIIGQYGIGDSININIRDCRNSGSIAPNDDSLKNSNLIPWYGTDLGRCISISGTNVTFNMSNVGTTINESEVGYKEISTNQTVEDTIAPTINTEIYVENKLETRRYTAGKEVIFKITTSERIQGDYTRPVIQIRFSESGIGKYNYEGNGNDGYAKCIDAKINLDSTTTWTYSYQIQQEDEGQLEVYYIYGWIEDIAGNKSNLSSLEKVSSENVYADTTAPTVKVEALEVENNITNKDVVTYKFTWSEEIKEFTKENITVNNGQKGTLSNVVKNADGTYSYTMDITTSVENGNVGDLQVIIEQDACQDLVGQSNVRTESVIRVDKKAAVLESLEAYIESEIKLNSEVDVVKEYYKTGEKIIVVATFDENIVAEKIPELVLQFSESKNSVIPEGKIEGNKITYTYTIVEKDEGTVSVRAFNGTVIDATGNETKVVRKSLDGNTIIVDTDVPSLNELKVTTAEGTYKAGSTITIEAIYDEKIYSLENKEIKLITNNNAPELKLTFGGKAANGTVQAIGYGQTEGKTDRTKIKYTYTITDGDNGILGISSYSNKENIQMCDIAGNVSSLNKNQTGNEIIADTIRPEVTNIAAKVENSLIRDILGDPDNTETGYYKEGNEIKITLTFSEKVSGKVLMPNILVGFSEEKEKEPTKYSTYAYESDWNVNSETIEYTYTVNHGDNGYLWVKVPENQFDDIAGNGNVAENGTELINIYADTTRPTVTLLRDAEVEQNDQTIVIKAKFSENVYDLEGTKRITLTKGNAPILIYSFGVGNNKEVAASEVKGDTITYTITKDPVEENGTLLYELAKGNLCDRAGNLYYIETTDTTAPELESVVITTKAGKYAPYCKEGAEIYVTATFNEEIKTQVMKLKVKVGEKELNELLEGEIVNGTQVKYTYTVKAGDTGAFSIVDICGNTNEEREAEDKTYGFAQDLRGNQKNIYNLTEEKITVTGRAIADTTEPYIASIQAIANGKEVARYTKEVGKDAVITVGRTNANIVEYIVTHSEEVPYKHLEGITITNGTIISREAIDSYKYKITVQTTVEGVQSLIIPEATVEDKAGNIDGFVRIDALTVDFTKPTVRFISEYNGGIYVLPTNIDKVEIRPNVEISENIAKIEYKWDNGEYVEIENYSSSSDIAVPTKAFTEYGQYKLFIKVIDLAGNDYETSKTYKVLNSNIGISVDKIQYTNEDVIATVTFGEGLTDNRKVTFKAEGTNEIVELNAAGTEANGTKYVIEENGTIYAEATDRVGNKVFTEYTVRNIDKEKPVIELELNGANLVIGTGKDKATIKTNVEVTDNNYSVETKFAYLDEDINISNITAAQKAKISNNLNNEAKIENALSTNNKTPYYLYVIAKDIAGNETIVKSNPFTVLDTNERIDGENTIPAEKIVSELIIFEQMEEDEKDKAYVYVNHDYSIIEELEISLDDESYGFVNYEYDNVELYGNTKIIVKAWDACGNEVTHKYEVTDIVGPEFTISGNPEVWTNGDVELKIYSNAQLKALTLNGENILGDNKYRIDTVITGYGNYIFKATDIYNNTSEQTIEVKIDKSAPEITDVKIEEGKIVITANDIDKTLNKELSGLAEYAITDTTEVPVEWSKSNEINVTKDTNFFVWAKDNAGNIITKEEIVVRDITAPELTITTDVKLYKWTNTDVKVDVKADEELSSLVLKYKEMEEQEGQQVEVEKEEDILEAKTYTITLNGTYEVIGKDKSGNETKETIIVSKIDKDVPVISTVENEGKDITITATDGESGVKEYAITSTTEEPVEWSKSNVIKVTEDGIFYAWAKDNAGNISRAENAIEVDTTAPTMTFNYLSQTVTVGMPVEANIVTNEEAIISYSWDKETWVNSEELISRLTVSEKTTTPGKQTLYVKAKDKAGNESKVQALEFEVVTMEEIKKPDIIFEDIPTLQINGARYVKVSSNMTAELLIDSMNKEALCGKTPEYINLTEDGKLKTGTEITINNETKYIVVINGDVNCDGKIDFLGDLILANNYRLGLTSLNTMQKLAADINNSGEIEFIPDILAINNYRLGIIKSL